MNSTFAKTVVIVNAGPNATPMSKWGKQHEQQIKLKYQKLGGEGARNLHCRLGIMLGLAGRRCSFQSKRWGSRCCQLQKARR